MITRVQDYYMTMTMYKHYKEIISRGQNLISIFHHAAILLGICAKLMDLYPAGNH
jgi:hypothetical protein